MRKAKREQDEEVARVKMFIDRFRYQATKASQVQSRIKMLEKVVPIEVPAERKKIHFNFPVCEKSGRTVLELKHVRKAYGDLVVFKDLESAHRARRPHCAGRPQRRGQVDADADAVRRRSAGLRRTHRGPQSRHAVLRAGRGDPDGSESDGPRHAVVGLADPHGADDQEHPRRVPVLGRRHLQEGQGPLGRRTHPSRGRAHAAEAVEHAPAGRADQSPRSGFQGSPARRAGRLRRHADLRLARSILRRAPRHESDRGRRRRRARLSGHLQGVPLAQGTSRVAAGSRRSQTRSAAEGSANRTSRQRRRRSRRRPLDTRPLPQAREAAHRHNPAAKSARSSTQRSGGR